MIVFFLSLCLFCFAHVAGGKLHLLSALSGKIILSQKSKFFLPPANKSRRTKNAQLSFSFHFYISLFNEHQIVRYTFPSLASFTFELSRSKRVLLSIFFRWVIARESQKIFFRYAMESETWLKSLMKTLSTSVWRIFMNFTYQWLNISTMDITQYTTKTVATNQFKQSSQR